jgi:hypothetical protein
MNDGPIRVIQWSTGNVGAHALRAVLDRPGLELAGVYVTNPAKAGRDAGDLVGRPHTGILATSSVEEIVALDADVVVHTSLPSLVHGDAPTRDVDDFCRLLESGKHVVTTVGYMYPKVHGEALVGRLQAACTTGRSVFHGTGANPGWFGDLLPLLMTGLSLTVDRIEVQEISNFQLYPSPEIMFDMMNFGRTPEAFAARSARHRHWLDGLFSEAVTMVADGLGVEVERVESSMSTWIAEADLETAAGVVGAGTVAGQRWQWEAIVGGKPLVSQETVWRMHAAAAPQWPVGDWSVTVHGTPRMHVSLPHRWNRDVLASTAAHAINVIPYLPRCAPGIATFLDLPLVAGLGAAR